MVTVSVYGDIVEVDLNRFITIEDVIDSVKEYADESNTLPSSHLLVINATNCRTNIGLKDLARLDQVNELLSEKFELLKVAVLINDPMYTAICMIYQKLIKSNHYHFQVFSTRGAAHRWLKR
ncbi:hypothetical protein [Labilibacter marinus]|uniref:hypothetical protein n=1 Tax=Labilibacter marinus TaxID=1477105 RepID=UPI00082A0008|nr:hypothetical protein [Labilibacter marinus]